MNENIIKFYRKYKSLNGEVTEVEVKLNNIDIGFPELLNLFKDFALACGYQPETVNEYLGYY